ncbi:PREDICTED: cystatin-like [Charadrius vociferus]|uniref:cystatin-like n=1 Tax=Charadrius vociferus TaxID=50402 RepID=UPI0005219004|nr:PREDICTED: cystatin-like [Charadrius vociferus]
MGEDGFVVTRGDREIKRSVREGSSATDGPLTFSRTISIVAGIKYIMKVEIGRTTCPKPATDLQSCAFHDAPQMAKHTICNFVVYTVPWLNQIKLLESNCQ